MIKQHSIRSLSQLTHGLFTLVVSGILLSGCNDHDGKLPDVSNIKVVLQTARFDQDLYAIDTTDIAGGLRKLEAKYPDFLNYYLDTLMAFGINHNYSDTTRGIRDGLKILLTYKDFKGLQDSINTKYPDTKSTDEVLKSGFTFLKYYFPEAPVPKILYVNMRLSNWPSFPLDANTLCVGLDMFLGEQYPFYRSVGVPAYMASHLRKNYIPVSVFSSLYKSTHPFQPEDRTLLDLIIQRGKEQYFLHKILPLTPDSTLFGFSALQVEWCSENEAMIYNFFIHENLLYSKETQRIQSYVFDGPYAPGIPASGKISSSPGSVGIWLGYRIVSAYMAQHPAMTLKELVQQQQDPAAFLDGSRYRPK